MGFDALLEGVLELRVVIAPVNHAVPQSGGAETVSDPPEVLYGQSEAHGLEGGPLDLGRVPGEELVQEQLRVSAAGGPVAVGDPGLQERHLGHVDRFPAVQLRARIVLGPVQQDE